MLGRIGHLELVVIEISARSLLQVHIQSSPSYIVANIVLFCDHKITNDSISSLVFLKVLIFKFEEARHR